MYQLGMGYVSEVLIFIYVNKLMLLFGKYEAVFSYYFFIVVF